MQKIKTYWEGFRRTAQENASGTLKSIPERSAGERQSAPVRDKLDRKLIQAGSAGVFQARNFTTGRPGNSRNYV